MIRLREENYPPPYQLDAALRVMHTDKDMSLRILHAEPLYPVYHVALLVNKDHETHYTDGLYGDPYTPLAITTREHRSIKVIYQDAYEEYQTRTDKLFSSDEFGTYYSHVLDWFNDENSKKFDHGHNDKRYHEFNPIGHYDVLMVDLDDKKKRTILVWKDLTSKKSYCCETLALLM